ncbi:hypothetical protein Lal_00020770 [Lupinus albus]|nr:hypothetical protein Lal_00020770 [Lupinus albus]
MSSQNEENNQGTMVYTQTPVTQKQKRKRRGVTSIKSIIRARSKNIKLTVEWNSHGQPCNNKGGNTLISYIGVLNVFPCNLFRQFLLYFSVYAYFDVDEQHKDYIMKSVGKALREFRTNCGKCLRDAEDNVNLKPPTKYANLIDKFEQSETPSPSSAAVDLDVLWVDARKNMQCVIDNEKVQEIVNRVGIINNCKLFLDISYTRAVGIDTMYNTHDAMIHNAQIPSNHLRVSIDISIEDGALLSIPVDEDTITVRGALGTFVAWPVHLIDVVSIMVSADHSATSPLIIDEHASKKAKVVKSKPQSKSNLESLGEVTPKKTNFCAKLMNYVQKLPVDSTIPKIYVIDLHHPSRGLMLRSLTKNNDKDCDYYVINFMKEETSNSTAHVEDCVVEENIYNNEIIEFVVVYGLIHCANYSFAVE